jgi:hypothetical protein
MQIIVIVNRIWVLSFTTNFWGVLKIGIAFHVGNPSSPIDGSKARMHRTSHIRVLLVPKHCVCLIINYGSRVPYLNPGLLGASPTLNALS